MNRPRLPRPRENRSTTGWQSTDVDTEIVTHVKDKGIKARITFRCGESNLIRFYAHKGNLLADVASPGATSFNSPQQSAINFGPVANLKPLIAFLTSLLPPSKPSKPSKP